jgi:hypothetical protein
MSIFVVLVYNMSALFWLMFRSGLWNFSPLKNFTAPLVVRTERRKENCEKKVIDYMSYMTWRNERMKEREIRPRNVSSLFHWEGKVWTPLIFNLSPLFYCHTVSNNTIGWKTFEIKSVFYDRNNSFPPSKRHFNFNLYPLSSFVVKCSLRKAFTITRK